MNSCRIVTQVEKYISYKQSLGYQIKTEAEELRRFAAFAIKIGHIGSLTTDVVFQWLNLKSGSSQWYKARKLETLRTFAKFVCVFDVDAQMPPKGVFGKCHGRTTPYIFSEEEIGILMRSASQLHSSDGLRGKSVSTIIGLLWSTGMRPNEACSLLNSDVDLRNGMITVRETKFAKSRLLPLHPSTTKALASYVVMRDNLRTDFMNDHFFIITNRCEMKLRNLEYSMQVIRKHLPSYSGEWKQRAPRLYDLRHSFACHTLLRWLESGVDVNNKMLYLATYLGHVKISDTYWYLTGIPELMELSSKLFGKYFYAGSSNHEDQ